MTRLDHVLAALRHEEPEIVPNLLEFTDFANARKKLLREFGSGDDRETMAVVYDYLDNFIVTVTRSGFLARTLEDSADHKVVEFETGSRWKVHKNPFWREYIGYPIRERADLAALLRKMPDPAAGHIPEGFAPSFKINAMYATAAPPPGPPERPAAARVANPRYTGIAGDVAFFKEKGFFTTAEINGFFSGVWYFLRPFQEFLIDLVADEGFAAELINVMGEFNLKDAEYLLETGVHCIDFCDDLGFNTGMFISPRVYEKLILPWHVRLAELCHRYGACVNMHSHGNINEAMPLIVDAGIDILNPVGPSDGMNLGQLKARYGSRITFLGGMSKYIGGMSPSELEAHVRDVVDTGAPGGGFMLKAEGGVPTAMPVDNFRLLLEVSRRYRRRRSRRDMGVITG